MEIHQFDFNSLRIIIIKQGNGKNTEYISTQIKYIRRKTKHTTEQSWWQMEPEVIAKVMMKSSNGNIFRVTGHLCAEFTGYRWFPRTKASDAEIWFFFLDLRLNNLLSKQSWGWWFEKSLRPLWHHCNVMAGFKSWILMKPLASSTLICIYICDCGHVRSKHSRRNWRLP